MTHSPNWMKLHREHLGLSQEQVARLLTGRGLQVTKQAYSKWESGHVPLPLQSRENREAIASVFQMTVTQLLRLCGYEIDTPFSPQAQVVAVLFDTLDEREQESILLMIEAFKSRASSTTPLVLREKEAVS